MKFKYAEPKTEFRPEHVRACPELFGPAFVAKLAAEKRSSDDPNISGYFDRREIFDKISMRSRCGSAQSAATSDTSATEASFSAKGKSIAQFYTYV